MAYVGLRKPIIGAMKEDGTYNDPFTFGKAIGLQVTPNYAEGSLYGDDAQAEYDKEFSYAAVTLNTSTIPLQANKEMFGHQVDDTKKEVDYGKDDENGYVGMGWISVEKVDGVRSFIGNFLYKVKFSEPSDDFSTKGESIEYKTPSIEGRATAIDTSGLWKSTSVCETEEAAETWINTKFGKTTSTKATTKTE